MKKRQAPGKGQVAGLRGEWENERGLLFRFRYLRPGSACTLFPSGGGWRKLTPWMLEQQHCLGTFLQKSGPTQTSFICSEQLRCPTGKGQGSRRNPSWAVPEPAFSATAHTARPLLTCASPIHCRPGSHCPVISGTRPSGYPEAPRSWAKSENLRQVWRPR